jgi:hypothetical protein
MLNCWNIFLVLLNTKIKMYVLEVNLLTGLIIDHILDEDSSMESTTNNQDKDG